MDHLQVTTYAQTTGAAVTDPPQVPDLDNYLDMICTNTPCAAVIPYCPLAG